MDTYLCDSFWDITYIHLAPMATAFTPVRQANHPTETRRADIERPMPPELAEGNTFTIETSNISVQRQWFPVEFPNKTNP